MGTCWAAVPLSVLQRQPRDAAIVSRCSSQFGSKAGPSSASHSPKKASRSAGDSNSSVLCCSSILSFISMPRQCERWEIDQVPLRIPKVEVSHSNQACLDESHTLARFHVSETVEVPLGRSHPLLPPRAPKTPLWLPGQESKPNTKVAILG